MRLFHRFSLQLFLPNQRAEQPSHSETLVAGEILGVGVEGEGGVLELDLLGLDN